MAPWMQRFLHFQSVVVMLYWSALNCTPCALLWRSTGLSNRWRGGVSTMLNYKAFQLLHRRGKHISLCSNTCIQYFCIYIFLWVHACVHAILYCRDIFLNWSVVDLQCHVSLSYTAKWFSHINIYTYIYICTYIYIKLFQILFPYRLLQNIEYSPLCYTVGPCCLSILYIVVCIC